MAWIEQLAPRDTDTGSSRAYDTTCAIPCATVFAFQKTNAGKGNALGKQEGRDDRRGRGDGAQEKQIRSLALIVSSN